MKPNLTRTLVFLLAGLAVVPVVWLALHPGLVEKFYAAPSYSLSAGTFLGSVLFVLKNLVWVHNAIWGLNGLCALLGSILASILVARQRKSDFAGNLALALAASALAVSNFALVQPLHLFASRADWVDKVFDYSGTVALALAMIHWLRFFLSYPVRLDIHAFGNFQIHLQKKSVLAGVIAKAQKRETQISPESVDRWLGRFGIQSVRGDMEFEHSNDYLNNYVYPVVLGSRSFAWVLFGTFFGGFLITQFVHGTGIILPVFFLVSAIIICAPLSHITCAFHFRTGSAEIRRRVSWFYWGLILAVWIFFIPVIVFTAYCLYFYFVGGEINSNIGLALSFGVSPFLSGYLFLLAVGMAVFYEGAIDPRLAIRKTNLCGFFLLIFSIVLVAAQTTAVHSVVSRLGLPGYSSTIGAGMLTAMVFGPIREKLEDRLDKLFERMIPASELAESVRVDATVVFADLSGYTELSARDEKSAVTVASLLHKEGERLAEAHKGRQVKSMGDAVMWDFAEPANAIAACRALRAGMAEKSVAMGLPLLPLHFGLHCGEVVRSKTGDLFGGTVNLAARLLGVATAGEIVVSLDVVQKLAGADFSLTPLGQKSLKNVPQPVTCFRVA